MKRILTLTLAFVFIFGLFTSASQALEVRVSYVNVKIGASREVNAKIRIGEHNKKPLVLYDGNRNMVHELRKNSMVDVEYNSETKKLDIYDWGGNFIISVDPGSGSLIGSSDKNNSIVTANGRSYRGYLYFVKNDKVDVVNHVPLQQYLYGVVPREMPAATYIEAVKAQAITARTYAVMNRNSHSSQGYGLCDTTHCQVYGGYYIREGIGEHPNSNRAVDETRNQVVTHNGRMVSTHYHANSGGRTESSEYVWANALPYERGKQDPYSIGVTDSTWERTLPLTEIEQKLKTSGHNVGDLYDIKILNRTPSGRANELQLIGSNGEKKIKATAFRSAVGGTVIRSTWFNMERIDESFEGSISIIDRLGNTISRRLKDLSIIGADRRVTRITRPVTVIGIEGIKTSVGDYSPGQIKFTGKGYGHGVGMSQRGAMEMGKQGYNYEQILKFYYTGIQIDSINQ